MSAFSPATADHVQKSLDVLKRRNAGQKPLTNYFFQCLNNVSNLRMFESATSLCFLHDEWDFSRLYLYTFDLANLQDELGGLTWPPIVVTDWLSKNGPEPMDSFLRNLGFHFHAIYDRIIYKNPRKECANNHVALADSSDRDAIHALLFRVFDKYADHIMSVEELGELIAKEQVILSRDGDQSIDGLVILPIKGENCNFNFLYNCGGPSNLARILGNFYGVLNERGVKTGFSWVRRTRPLVLRLHESCGWKRDGFTDYIYLR